MPRRNKRVRAQAQSEIFVYVLGAIIFVLVLLYGYKALGDIRAKGDLVKVLKEKSDLEAKINAMKTESGTVRKHDLFFPGKYTKACFIDLTKASIIKSDISYNALGAISTDAYAAVSSKADRIDIKQNIFLVPSAPVELFIAGMVIDDPYWFCIDATQGSMSLRLESMGRNIKVSSWS